MADDKLKIKFYTLQNGLSLIKLFHLIIWKLTKSIFLLKYATFINFSTFRQMLIKPNNN